MEKISVPKDIDYYRSHEEEFENFLEEKKAKKLDREQAELNCSVLEYEKRASQLITESINKERFGGL
jgi:hypothetical protein